MTVVRGKARYHRNKAPAEPVVFIQVEPEAVSVKDAFKADVVAASEVEEKLLTPAVEAVVEVLKMDITGSSEPAASVEEPVEAVVVAFEQHEDKEEPVNTGKRKKNK